MASFRISDCTTQRAPGRLIRRIDKTMRELADGRLTPLGLSYPQWVTIKLVEEGTVSTAGDLARELDYTSGATTRLIDGLETMGHIARTRDTGDRRVVQIAVTPSGAALCGRGREIVVGLWNEMLVGIGQDEANAFVDTLVKLQSTVEAAAANRTLPTQEAAE